MRLSFTALYRDVLVDINRTNEDLAKYTRQVSSQRRLNTASDDPTSAVAAVGEHTEIGTLDQYTRAADSVSSRLTIVDTVMSDIVSKLTAAKSSAAGARSTVLTDTQRQAAANELAGIRDALVSDMNTQYRGKYVFAGSTSTTAPYVLGPGGTVTAYQGDARTVSVDVDRGLAVGVSFNGDALAKGSDTNDMFTELNGLIAAVQTGNSASIDTGISAMQRAFDRAVAVQTGVGTDLKALEDQKSRLSQLMQASQTRLGADENADLTTAITALKQADTAHSAALSVASTIGKLSLLDFLR